MNFVIKKNINLLILLLIIFNSTGIRFFQGQGIILSIIIFIILVLKRPKALFNLRMGLIYLFFVFILFTTIFINGVIQFNQYLIFILNFINAALYILSYDDISDFYLDFKIALKIIFIHAIISIILLPIPTFSFKPEIRYYSILYIFNYTDSPFPLIPHGRITCLFWEPGLLQYFLNLYLLICISEQEKIRKILFIIISIIFTFSTVGFILLIFNVLYWVFKQKLKIYEYLIIIAIALSLSPLIIYNFNNKFSGGDNSSFLVRQMNAGVAIGLIINKPLVGYGLVAPTYYYDNNESYNLMTNFIDKESIETMGLRSVGITNSILQIAIYFGIPLTILILTFMYNQKLILNAEIKILLFTISVLTCFSEPIFFTSLFLMFPISSILLKRPVDETEQD